MELEKVKAESHKRKKIIATQQLVMQNGKEAYNKVASISVINSISENVQNMSQTFYYTILCWGNSCLTFTLKLKMLQPVTTSVSLSVRVS